MSIWSQMAKEASSTGAGMGRWIKLKNDGDSVLVIPLGDPAWIEKDMPASQYGPATRKKFGATNMWVVDTGEVKVWESGPQSFGDIADAIAEGGEGVYRIKRKGAAGDSKTRYICTRVRDVSPDEKGRLLAAKLHELSPDAIPF